MYLMSGIIVDYLIHLARVFVSIHINLLLK